MLSPTLIVIALTMPAALTAQSPGSSASRAGVMLPFENVADKYGSRLIDAFDSIPADRYNYRPTVPQQTIGYIAQHLEAANYDLCDRLGDRKHPRTAKDSLSDSVKAAWPKDTLVARLRASFRFCDAALEHEEKIPTLDSAARVSYLLAFETDLAEHYSQISVYMRLLGMVPPSALPPRRRAAVELPASALSAFVGVYQLAAGMQFDVTVRGGALFIKSTVSPAWRLWPESSVDFFLRDVDAQITFTRGPRGAVTGLVLHQYGRDRPAPKIR